MAKFKLDETDHKILDMLIENTRTPFTDIAKNLKISAGTVHVLIKNLDMLLLLMWVYFFKRHHKPNLC